MNAQCPGWPTGIAGTPNAWHIADPNLEIAPHTPPTSSITAIVIGRPS